MNAEISVEVVDKAVNVEMVVGGTRQDKGQQLPDLKLLSNLIEVPLNPSLTLRRRKPAQPTGKENNAIGVRQRSPTACNINPRNEG